MSGDPIFAIAGADLDAHVSFLEERAFVSVGIDDGARAAQDVWRRGGGEADLLSGEEVERACYEGRGCRGAISARLSRAYSAGFRAGWEAWRTQAEELSVSEVLVAAEPLRKAS